MKEKDYTYKDLFKSRVEITKYVIKNRILTILNILIFLLPFILPLCIWTIYSRYYLFKPVNSDTDLLLYIMKIHFPGLFFSFFYGIGLSGLFYCFRRLLYTETVKVSYHYIKGIKESGFEFGLFASITYIIYIIYDYFLNRIYLNTLYNNSNVILFILIFIILFITLIFTIFIMIHVMSSASLYVASFNQVFKDAFTTIGNKIFKRFLIFFISNLPLLFIVMYFNNNYMIINILGFISFIILSNSVLLFYNLGFIYDLFDEKINRNIYPNYYYLGIYRKEKENAQIK